MSAGFNALDMSIFTTKAYIDDRNMLLIRSILKIKQC